MRNFKIKNLSLIFALLLSVALICTGLLMSVGAESGNAAEVILADGTSMEYATFNEAVTATKGKEVTIKLLSDITLTSTYQPSAATVLDLNGHTLTADASLDANNSPVFRVATDFTITGSGEIIVNSKRCFVTSAGGNLKIIGNEKLINITKSENAASSLMFEIAYADVLVQNAKLELNNPDQNQNIVYVANTAGDISFQGVEIKALHGKEDEYTEGGSSVLINQNRSIFNILKTDAENCPTLSLSYCTIDALNYNGINYGTNSVKKDGFIAIDNSYISLKASHNEYNTTLFPSYVEIASDIIIKDSYVEYGGKTAVSTNIDGSALILDNTTFAEAYYASHNNNFFRHGNVILKNSSALISYSDKNRGISSHANTNKSYLTVGDSTNANVLISEGTRFDLNTKNKIAALSDGQVVFPNGKAPYGNTEYAIIYDPSGNPDAPYVLAAIGSTTPYIEHDSNGITQTWGGETAGLNEKEKRVDNNTFFKFTKTEDGAEATLGLIAGLNNTAQASDNKILVFDYDVSADVAGGFAPFTYFLHVRDAGGGDSARVSLYSVSNSGRLTPNNNYIGGDAEYVDLIIGEWNHITMVVDTTYYETDNSKASSYLYVNGIYLGCNTVDTYKSVTGPIHGQRWELNKLTPVGATLMLDNSTSRVYSPAFDESGAPIHITKEEADSYLINGGKTYSDACKSDAITIGGVAISSINEALEIQEKNGLIASLNKDVNIPQTVTTEGKIYSNGFTINIAEDSIPVDLVDGIYDFNTRITGVKVNISTYSEFGFNIYIPEAYKITKVTLGGIDYTNAVSTAVVDGAIYSKITVYKDIIDASKDISVACDIERLGTKIITINLQSYAEAVLKANSSTIDDIELIYYMLAYANEAGKYFGNANEAIETLLGNTVYFDGANTENYAYEATADDISSVFSKVAVDIDSSDLSYIFTISENAPEFSLTVGNSVYTNADAENGILRIGGLKVYTFAKDVLISANGTEAIYNLDSILDYYITEAAKGENEYSKALPLVRAFFNYTQNAEEYKENRENAETAKYQTISLGGNNIKTFSILASDETLVYAEKINSGLVAKTGSILPIIYSAEESNSGNIIDLSVGGAKYDSRYHLNLNGSVFTIGVPTVRGMDSAVDAFLSETGIETSEERIITIPDGFSYAGAYSQKLSEIENPTGVYLRGDVVGGAYETKIGEDVTFYITLNANNTIVGADGIKCEIHGDNRELVTEIYHMDSGEIFITVPGLEQPGLVQMKITAVDALGNAITSPEVKSITIGAFVEAEEITNAKGTPDDFSEFWQELIDELYTIDPFDTSAPADDQDSENYYHLTKITAENITYYKEQTSWQSYGRGITTDALNYVDIYEFALKAPGKMPATGFITIPKDTSKTYPIKLTTCGYGIYRAFMKWDTNCISVSMNTHGEENMVSNDVYQMFRSTSINSGGLSGYGIQAADYENPENAYFTYVLLRNMQALRFAKAYTENIWNGTITAEGASQAGFQSIAAAALATLTHGDIKIESVNATVPWLCDIGGDVLGRKVCDILKYYEGVEYFDSANFAKLISSETTVTIKGGFADPTVSPTGVISIYNNLNCPKTLVFVQNHDHSSAPKENGIEHTTSKDYP